MHRLATVHARDNQRHHDTAYLNKRLFTKVKWALKKQHTLKTQSKKQATLVDPESKLGGVLYTGHGTTWVGMFARFHANEILLTQ